MKQVEFQYNGAITIIQCNENDKMKEICNKFAIKVGTEINSLYFICEGKLVNYELTFNESLNNEGKNKIIILVYSLKEKNEEKEDKSIVYSKDVICPICAEKSYIDIINYKISLYDCKNKHRMDNILIDEYEKTQYIEQSKIICDICKVNKKSETYKNEFYKCNICKINLCPICHNNHDKNHIIIKYDQRNYICYLHNCKYNAYCENCKNNICMECEQLHQNHNIKYFGKILPKSDVIKLQIEESRKNIDIFNNNINDIIKKLEKVKDNIEKLYKINCEIINNYDVKNVNYELLQNINKINNFNINIIQDLNRISNENNIMCKLKNIIEIYYKMNDKNFQENIINDYKNKFDNIKKENKKIIYDIKNFNESIHIFGSDFVKNNKDKCYIIYNNKKYKLKTNFKFEKNGPNELELYEVEQLKDLSDMFSFVSSINSFEFLSNWDLSNIENISRMFANTYINDLKPLSKWNTSNIKNMNGLFMSEELIHDLDPIKNWDVSNVQDMSSMFYGMNINSLKSLEKWDLFKVTKLNYMFCRCKNLNSLEGIENWTLFNCIDISGMFSYCSNIKSLIPLKNWDTSEIKNFSNLFNCSNNIQSLEGLENWDTSNAQDISGIFYGLSLIKELKPLKNWKLNNCLKFDYALKGCKLIEDISPISSWLDKNYFYSNITSKRTMESMFENCLSLKSVDSIKDWNLRNEFDNLQNLFANCKSIEDFSPISKWKINKDVKVDGMFSGTNQKGIEQFKFDENQKKKYFKI